MKIYINNQKLDVKLLTSPIEKFKSFKFKLSEIEEGLCFKNKKIINTYFFCQNVDIIFTNKENIVLKYFINVKSEKLLVGNIKNYYIYILKSNTIKNLDINKKLKVEYTKDELKKLEN